LLISAPCGKKLVETAPFVRLAGDRTSWSSTEPYAEPVERDTHCGVNHLAMSGRTHGSCLPLGIMQHHKASFRRLLETSGTWRESLFTEGTWQRAKAACDLLKRIFDNQLEAGSRGSKTKPSDDPEFERSSGQTSEKVLIALRGNVGLNGPSRKQGRHHSVGSDRPATCNC
jgi:hypothetical protein